MSMTLSGNELAQRTSGGVEMRAEPVRCRVRLSGLATGDIHDVDLSFSCAIAALDRRGERELFAEVFLTNRHTATAEDVAAHLSPAMRDAAFALLATQGAEHWMSDEGRRAIADVLRDAGKRVAFACGVDLLPPFEVSASSPSLERERLEATGRKLSERRTAGQLEHVQRAAELLKQFESLRATMPGLSPGQLLGRVSDGDRGSMLQSLLIASANGATQSLWAVAGPNLLKIDPRSPERKTSVIELPTDLGPLRSVQADDGKLLIGAQSGVMIVDPMQPSQAKKLRDANTTSQLGYNSVARAGGLVWASHSEAGLVAWRESEPDTPVFRQPSPARNVTNLDDSRVIFSAEGSIFVVDQSGERRLVTTCQSPPIFLGVERDRIVVIGSSGEIEQIDRSSLARIDLRRRTGELSSAGVLPWMGSNRLLLATCDGPVACVGEDDPVVTQYTSAHRGLRAVTGCADVVAALSADRQRIVLWNSWAENPVGEIHVAAIARHRAADICFA